MKYSLVFAVTAPLLVLAAPTPADSKLAKKTPAEPFFIQTDVGWFDAGDGKKHKKREEVEKREPGEPFFIQTDVGWFDGGDGKRKKRETAKSSNY
ncbi:hypothetical protein FZEAL_4074 [Fusarium zealandicum]|uniref:Uncharacterized protein n=1 Tax=Fusarium zealandicum TaxID=1053134 RepID=A0A8H4UMG0_9HYPO|nr:hypothetical protein FZEAL_4074 [Fusarium zealandicum]